MSSKPMNNLPQSLYEALQMNCTPQLVNFYGHNMEQFDMPLHAHLQLEIMYVVSGRCRIVLDQEEVILREASFIFLDALTPHRLVIDQPCRIYMLEILCKVLSEGIRLGDLARNCPTLLTLARQGHPRIVLHDNGELFQIINQIQTERENNSNRRDHLLKLSALFTNFFIELARCAEADRQHSGAGHVRTALKYIQTHYDCRLSVDIVARAAEVHPVYLQRLFQNYRQQTISEYIRQLRLDKACMLLLNSDLPIIDIAISAGYNSRQNFGLAFIKKHGISPTIFRRQRGNQAILPGERDTLSTDDYLPIPCIKKS